MKSKTELRQELERIHRKSYPAYKDLRGQYDFGDYVLSVDHVQGDPFASPSNVSVIIPMKKAGFPELYWKETYARVALEDVCAKNCKEAADYSLSEDPQNGGSCQPSGSGATPPFCAGNKRRKV